MADGFCVGSMDSSVGWETKSVPAALSRHFTYFFASRRDQGKVLADTPSFYYTWKQYGENPDVFQAKCKTVLEAYIKELFSTVSVSVTRELVEGSVNHYTMQLAARVTYEGQTYDLATSVYVTGQEYQVLDQRRLG